jgi:hypothetical protein
MKAPAPKIYVDGDAAKKLCGFILDVDQAMHDLYRLPGVDGQLGVRWMALKAAIEAMFRVEEKGDRHGE